MKARQGRPYIFPIAGLLASTYRRPMGETLRRISGEMALARVGMAALLATSLAVTPAAVFGQTGDAATDVAPVSVIGVRKPPVEMIPWYGACLEAINDPTIAALVSAGEIPRIYTQTRPPRNPDYNAPPRTPPGSAMPTVFSLKGYQRYLNRVGLADWTGGTGGVLGSTEDATADGAEQGDADSGAGMSGVSVKRGAVAFCLGDFGGLGRGGSDPNPFSRGGVETGPSRPIRPWAGRQEIRLRDITLPLGFALFDDGRYEEALVQFKKADKKIGGGEAQLMIGKIYLFALKDKSDPVEGVKWLKRVADERFDAWREMPVFDPKEPERNTAMGEACLILAHLYATGYGPIPKDPAQTRKYLTKAYQLGHIRAAKMLGDIYFKGIDTPRDPKLAFKAYMDAAKFAYVPAMNAVADMYAAGEVEGGPNPLKAAAWRNEAAKAEDPTATYALAVAYDRGEGVEADPDRALALYKLAAMHDEPAAMTALGTYFYRGEGGLPLDPVMARKWFLQAAARGDADGMFNLAAMMAKGEGGPLDRVDAWRWLTNAERRNHPGAAGAARLLETQFTRDDRAGVDALRREAAAAAATPQPAQ